MPSKIRQSEPKRGSVGLGLKIGLVMPYLATPPLIRPTRYSPHLFGRGSGGAARHLPYQREVGVRRRGKRRHAVGVGGYQSRLAPVGLGEQLVIRQASDQTGMHHAGMAHAGTCREVA